MHKHDARRRPACLQLAERFFVDDLFGRQVQINVLVIPIKY
jgi:hypothetical protein